MKTLRTHENYIADVMAVVKKSCTKKEAKILDKIKVVYGAGNSGTRGVTYFQKWKNGGKVPHSFVEICAFGESEIVQVCGTCFHESAHVLAGWLAAHGGEWKSKCDDLGLLNAKAAGHEYTWDCFKPEVRKALKKLKVPNDGSPAGLPLTRTGKPYVKGGVASGCSHGQGSRGGKSRGVNSGSRQVLVTCSDCGCKARLSRHWIEKGLPYCGNDDHGKKKIRMIEPS